MGLKPTCDKCDRTFSDKRGLVRHMNRKAPCDRKLKCDKCNKVFKHISNLKRHQNRKNPCDPILGDPTKNTPPDTCHFCYRTFAHKQSLTNHFNICKIKNGGMSLLFKKIEDLTKEVKHLKQNQRNIDGNNNTIDGNNNTINSNHHNTNITLNLIQYGSDAHDIAMATILAESLPLILTQPYDEGRPRQDQIKERIQMILTSVYRNPNHKQLQNIYVVPEKKEDNAFVYNGDLRDINCKKWKIGNWDVLSKDILSKIWNYADKNKTVRKKEDILNIMKHIFVLADLGESAVDEMTDDNVKELWTGIGKKLKYNTIIE
jgi:hypothetical protein